MYPECYSRNLNILDIVICREQILKSWLVYASVTLAVQNCHAFCRQTERQISIQIHKNLFL
jgi:hypothetical protein